MVLGTSQRDGQVRGYSHNCIKDRAKGSGGTHPKLRGCKGDNGRIVLSDLQEFANVTLQ